MRASAWEQIRERANALLDVYSLRWLAEQMGTDHATLSKYLSGKRMPPADKMERLANVIGLRVVVMPEPWAMAGPIEPRAPKRRKQRHNDTIND